MSRALPMLGAVFLLAASEQSFTLPVAHGVLPEAMRTIRVHEGDVVRLSWHTDRPISVHLHGYDIEWRILPGEPVETSFTAYATGRFEIAMHGWGGQGRQDVPLAVLEVYPR